MKSLKQLLAGAIALTLASPAFADTELLITGATAYRIQVNLSIAKLLGAADGNGADIKAVYASGASLSVANRSIFRGTVAGQPGLGVVTIKCSWSGSSAGMKAITQGDATQFLTNAEIDSITTPNAGLNAGSTQVVGGAVKTAFENLTPVHITMQDSAQESTPFTTGAALTSFPVGIVDFVYVGSKDAVTVAPFTSVNNMTRHTAQALFGGLGYLPVSYFTGNSADVGTVYATGRDIGSGTRVITLAENEVGPFSQIKQWKITASGGAITTTALFPAGTVLGIPQALGNSGESSGGTLNTLLQNTSASVTATGGPSGACMFVAGVSYEDVKAAITGGTLKEMAWNGVLYGGNKDLIRQGKYTFWGYERIAWRTTLAGDQLTLATLLKDQAITDAGALISTTSMGVTRQIDGGVVTP